MVTVGPGGEAMRLTEVFAALGLRRPGSTAIDVSAVQQADAEVRSALARAVTGVLSAAVALTDPALVVARRAVGPASGPPGGSGATSSRARRATYPSRPPPSTTSRR